MDWGSDTSEVCLTALMARSLRSGFQCGEVLVRACFWGVDGQLLLVLTGRRAEKGSRLSLDSNKGTGVIYKGLTLKSSSISYLPPKGPPLDITSRDGFPHINISRDGFSTLHVAKCRLAREAIIPGQVRAKSSSPRYGPEVHFQ